MATIATRPVELDVGQTLPVEATLRFGPNVDLSMPLGAYVRDAEVIRFVPTFDVIGLVAVILGIGTGIRLGSKALRILEVCALNWRRPADGRGR